MTHSNDQVELPFGMHSEAAERANRITHGLGCGLSVCGAIYLLGSVAVHHDPVRWIACALYVASLTLVYAMSTLSHCSGSPGRRGMFRALDQGCIYFLISGSVTPLVVTYLPATVGWLLLGTMWTISIIGFLAKVAWSHRIDAVSVWVYVLLGWIPILAVKWFLEFVPATALWWSLAGGLCYTFGTAFLILDHRGVYYHAVWHLFVMAGSTLHYMTILVYVAQKAS